MVGTALSVTGAATVGGNLAVAGTLSSGATLAVMGAATVGGDLTVTGALSVASLTVGGAALSAPAPPPTCLPPSATGLYFDGTSWVCTCAPRLGGPSCTVPLTSWTVSLLAGGCTAAPCLFDQSATPGHYSPVAGTGAAASIYNPRAIAVHPLTGNVYFVGANWVCRTAPYNCVAMVTPSGVMSWVDRTWRSANPTSTSTTGFPFIGDTMFTHAGSSQPSGLAFDSVGKLYIADGGAGTVYTVSPAGVVTQLTLTWPIGITSDWQIVWSIAVGNALKDGSGNPVLAAGSPGRGNSQAVGIYISGGAYNNCVMTGMLMDPSPSLTLSVLAGAFGNDNANGYADGTGTEARFNSQFGGVAVDSRGNVYLADYGNSKLRMITLAGVVSTVHSQTSSGTAAWSVAVDANDTVYFASKSGAPLMQYAAASGAAAVSSTGYFGQLNGLAFNAANTVLYAAEDGDGRILQFA